MAKQERPLAALTQFLPENTYEFVAPYFEQHVIHLTLTRHRSSIHGDYRAPDRKHAYHRISVNATLNKYSFLITLLHELAHMVTTVRFGLKAAPHGVEWKNEFRNILIPLMDKDLFPHDVERAIRAYLSNPAASTCTDPNLYKALSAHDPHKEGRVHVDAVPVGGHFVLSGRRFQKVENLRTRARCKCVISGKMYFVQGIAQVQLAES
jgi:hypothetical protein